MMASRILPCYSEFVPAKNQTFRAIERVSRRDAHQGPFKMTGRTKFAINAIDHYGNDRVFVFGTWTFRCV